MLLCDNNLFWHSIPSNLHQKAWRMVLSLLQACKGAADNIIRNDAQEKAVHPHWLERVYSERLHPVLGNQSTFCG